MSSAIVAVINQDANYMLIGMWTCGGLEWIPPREGVILGVTFRHAQIHPLSTFSTLLARSSSDAAHGYLYCSSLLFWVFFLSIFTDMDFCSDKMNMSTRMS